MKKYIEYVILYKRKSINLKCITTGRCYYQKYLNYRYFFLKIKT